MKKLTRIRLVRVVEAQGNASTRQERKLSGRDVVCPYLRREHTLSISCEGWWKGGTVKLCFEDGKAKNRYMERRCRCMQGYGRCLVARALEHKYAKEEKRGV